MVVAMIVACEVGFWVLIALGLLSRYVLHRRRLSNLFLYATPLLEVILLVVAVIDLRGGATAGARHGIAALYIGLTVMFGHRAIRWVDQRVTYHFLDGPLPWRPPARGMDRVRYEAAEFARTVGAMAIAGGLLAGLILITGDADRTKALSGFYATLGAITAISLVVSVVGGFEALGGDPKKEKPAPRRLRDRVKAS
ncbi:hypothetical protein [Embleya sp. NBC_00896]|uniref:hypothetical protein n=1 Tax=Embleya sp. NBC_00896 TaxID=2975961 RepID=UPI00386CE171|nr:hypothetical protein OG928_26230 [Embleya sp. NBC_00896]